MHRGLFTSLSRALEQAGSTGAAQPTERTQHHVRDEHKIGSARQGSAPAALSTEGMLVGQMLKRDFEKYGNHLGDAEQRRLAELTERSLRLGMAFSENLRTLTPCLCSAKGGLFSCAEWPPCNR